MRIYFDPVTAWVLTWSLTALWVAAAVHKLRDRAGFEGTLSAYALLPAAAVVPMAWLIPLGEILVAAGLLWPSSHRMAAAMGASLLLVYGAAIAINLHRGRRDLACGCLGFGRGQRISPWLLARNGLLVLASTGLAILPTSVRSWQWMDVCTVVGAVAVIALIYATAEHLTLTAQRLARTGA